ncbi:hypothetical protein AC482_01840 [miscellaneous Crenarchaeota group-15 archaeon DG-45]|uniref:Glycosidase n=1 Tax=miscellaneous Crenarchaeota group-15 archaeon DG-45 TaxID=1685127 RepID=A0A0M0BRD2_9ARCH|nr:MAG: hypothetical protein AC482_01840 [miscellaneous Crenarchaeota group-15 archaeon DG-45]
MKRYQGNPILKPIADHAWESRMVFNAAAVYLDKRVHILYRAIGEDNVSRIGYASSSDGYHIEERLPYPILEPADSYERYGCEDPRLTPLDGRCIMTYTALRGRVRSVFQIAMTFISEDDLVRKRWNWGERWLPFPGICNKDAVVFPRRINGRYVMYHRIEPHVCIAYSDDLRRWYDIKAVMEPRMENWDCLKIGAAGPPIEVEEGWLFIYHGVDFERFYRLGVALIDRRNPETVLGRSEVPILEPVEDYERFGKVPNVVFSCASVKLDDQLIIYYGAADTVLCAAAFNLDELLSSAIP